MPGSQSQSRLELVIAKTVQLKTLRSKTIKQYIRYAFQRLPWNGLFVCLTAQFVSYVTAHGQSAQGLFGEVHRWWCIYFPHGP